ncbi:MAG: DUF4347 domain-containing protein, partial [bacterium]
MAKHRSHRSHRPSSPPCRSSSSPQFEELEPRILFSADLPGLVADQLVTDTPAEQRVVEAVVHQTVDQARVSIESLDQTGELEGEVLFVEADSLDQSEQRELPEQPELPEQQATEWVVVDTQVDDYQQLVEDILSQNRLSDEQPGSRRFEVLYLNAEDDGIQRIAESLSGQTGISAIHLISHGEAGEITLGSSRLNLDSLAENQAGLSSWGTALSEEADILVYGCDLAANDNGKQLVDELALLTDADVAASTDLTGSAIHGGDWDLEYQHGGIEADIAVSQAAQADYFGLLAVSVDATTTTTDDTGATSITVSHTTSGSDRLMVVGLSMHKDRGPVSSVTYNGTALTLVGTGQNGGDEARIELWALTAPDTGTHDVVVNLAGGGHGAVVGVTTFTGVDQATPYGSFFSATGNSSSISLGGISSAADEQIFSVVDHHNGTSLTPDSGQTESWDLAINEANGGGYLASGASSVTLDWTPSNSEKWAVGAISIKPFTPGYTTFDLQEGVNGYSGTQDTEIQQGSASTSFGNATSINVDLDNGSGVAQGLIRFDDLFGSGNSQIPAGATITSASLELQVTGPSAAAANISLHQMLTDWDESSTWNSLSGGVSTDDVEAKSTADGSVPTPDTTGTITVTGLESSVQAWANGQNPNYGWLINTDNSDGWDFRSSEYATPNLRPRLVVTYTAPPTDIKLTQTTQVAITNPGFEAQALA